MPSYSLVRREHRASSGRRGVADAGGDPSDAPVRRPRTPNVPAWSRGVTGAALTGRLGRRRAGVVTPVTKQAISIRLDEDVIDWFRATGPKYQTRINAVLRSYVEQVGAAAQPSVRKRRAV